MKCTASDQNVDFHSHKYLNCAASFGPGRESNRADLFTAFSEQFGFYLNKNKRPTVLKKLSQQSVLCHCKHFSWCHGGISSMNHGCTCLQSSLNQAQAEQLLLWTATAFEVQFPSFGMSHFPCLAEHA